MARTWILAAVVIVVAALAFGVMAAVNAQRPKGSDIDQLHHMLEDVVAAANRGDVARIQHYVSDDYQDDTFTAPSLKWEIANYLHRHHGLNVEIPQSADVAVDPDGQTASVRFHVVLRGLEGSAGRAVEANIGLRAKKERVYYFLLFPGREWRVIRAEGYSEVPE